jgi:hypothetical protein
MNVDTERATAIAQKNDTFRRSGSGVTVTPGVLAFHNMSDLLVAIRDYNEFNEDNDPYFEHDFGSLVWNGTKIFWKIDSYDLELKSYGDPLSDESQQVLTVMLASEY